MAVYMIQAGDDRGPVKIGYGSSPELRRNECQVGNHLKLSLLRVFEGSVVEETLLHQRFADLHIRGEWHSFSSAMLGDIGLVEIIETVPGPAPTPPPEPVRLPLITPQAHATTRGHDIIGLWPSDEDFAKDAGVLISLVRVWRHRRSIPSDRWFLIESAAARRGIEGVTASQLARLVDVA